MYGVLSSFNNKDIIDLLEKQGVKTKIERGGRVFPESDKTKDVLDALLKATKVSNEEIEQMGKNGREFVKNNFNRNTVIHTYVNTINEISEEKYERWYL